MVAPNRQHSVTIWTPAVPCGKLAQGAAWRYAGRHSTFSGISAMQERDRDVGRIRAAD